MSNFRPSRISTSTGTDVHLVFLFSLGVFAALHWMIYVLWWPTPAYLTTHLIGIAGLALAFKPRSRLAFVVLALAFMIDAAIQAPVFSNHTMLKNFLLLGMMAAAIETLLRRERFDDFLLRLAPYGALILIGMYFFGLFHKINSDFLNPDVSCAVALWQTMPWPTPVRDSLLLHHAGIWGTFVIEALIVIMLLVPRWRHAGILAGIAFHMLLAPSGFEFYAPFSMLTITLHTLLLHPKSHQRVLSDPRFQVFQRWLRRPAGLITVAVYIGGMGLFAWMGAPTQVGLALYILVGLMLLVIWKHGRDHSQLFLRKTWQGLWAPTLFAAFMFNGFMPYLGGKTAQSFNMFANLRLEGDMSNHLVFSQPPGPLSYLADVVEITESQGIGWFTYIEINDLNIVYYDLLNHMERAGPNARVSYRRNGIEYLARSRADLVPEFERVLHPRWFRAWFHFTPVDLTAPKPCAVDR